MALKTPESGLTFYGKTTYLTINTFQKGGLLWLNK
jgi:hypothetical protein